MLLLVQNQGLEFTTILGTIQTGCESTNLRGIGHGMRSVTQWTIASSAIDTMKGENGSLPNPIDPRLRTEAHIGTRLNEQLDDQGRIFLAESKKNRIENGRLYLSPTFKWFDEDFEKQSGSVQSFTRPFFPKSVQAAIDGKTRISYTDYDWPLNERQGLNRSSERERAEPTYEGLLAHARSYKLIRRTNPFFRQDRLNELGQALGVNRVALCVRMIVVGMVRVRRIGERHGYVDGLDAQTRTPFEHRRGIRADPGDDELDSVSQARSGPVLDQFP